MQKVFHSDYDIWWTGWKGFPDAACLIGQWLAIPKDLSDPIRYFASYPGQKGWYTKGHHFDTSWAEGQLEIYDPVSPTAEEAKAECFHRLSTELTLRKRPEWAENRVRV
jgi:hypothetical protein